MVEVRRKVLAAMRQEGVVAVERALGRYVDLVAVHAFEDAVKCLRERNDINLVLCGMYFAETRMFDLLRFVQNKRPAVPVVCCRIGHSEVPRVTLEAVSIAAKSMGARDFVDLPLLLADHAADEEFRRLVLRHLR
jgi:DNA-binding NtrC family response regulator